MSEDRRITPSANLIRPTHATLCNAEECIKCTVTVICSPPPPRAATAPPAPTTPKGMASRPYASHNFRPSAADLKFLHRLRQTHFRNFKSKSGTRIIYLLVPLLLPKFVSEGAAMYHELRKRGTRIAPPSQRRRVTSIHSHRGR